MRSAAWQSEAQSCDQGCGFVTASGAIHAGQPEDRKFKRTFFFQRPLGKALDRPLTRSLGLAAAGRRPIAAPMCASQRGRIGVFPFHQPANLGSGKLWRSRSPQPGAPGRLKRVGTLQIGRVAGVSAEGDSTRFVQRGSQCRACSLGCAFQRSWTTVSV